MPGAQNLPPTIFVGSLSFNTTEQNLRAAFGPCGTVIDVRLPLSPEGRNRGFAYIQFREPSALNKALALNGIRLGGRQIRVDNAHAKKEETTRSRTVQLINVPFSATQEIIMKALAECGEPQDVRFIVDHNTGKHKGICYVEFATEEEAARLVAKSGFELSGRRVATAFAKEARPKEKVSARKQQKW